MTKIFYNFHIVELSMENWFLNTVFALECFAKENILRVIKRKRGKIMFMF